MDKISPNFDCKPECGLQWTANTNKLAMPVQYLCRTVFTYTIMHHSTHATFKSKYKQAVNISAGIRQSGFARWWAVKYQERLRGTGLTHTTFLTFNIPFTTPCLCTVNASYYSQQCILHVKPTNSCNHLFEYQPCKYLPDISVTDSVITHRLGHIFSICPRHKLCLA